MDLQLDVDMYLWPTRRSYTGQPMVEWHMIGSPPLLEATLEELYQHNVRPARPGEFTLRAFLAGRIDLMQAEAVLGVIDAHDHVELEQALKQLAGGLSGKLAAVRSELVDLLSDLEAGLDFADEDIEFVPRENGVERLGVLMVELEKLHDEADSRMHSNVRYRVVLGGLPNAGKSTLFNCLVDDEAAIVSPHEGTTRDYLTATANVGGLSIDLIDTAGWESSLSEVSAAIPQLAQDHRSQQFKNADLIVWCSSLENPAFDDEQFQQLSSSTTRALRIWTKNDLGSAASPDDLCISSHTGHGLEQLKLSIRQALEIPHSGERLMLGSTAARCRESLNHSIAALRQAHQTALSPHGDELISLEIREALDHLARILGTVYTDDILDQIFGKFCIGK